MRSPLTWPWAFFASILIASGWTASAWAADICAETVPANRFIDGIPAYAQCSAASTGAIYSNNGIDTSTTSGGTDWVRTQGSGGYQCTELAHRYLYFHWNVKSVPNGNAGVWCDGTIPAGLVKATPPVHGDLIVLAPGSCGSDTTTGHVAVVDTVNTDLSVMAVQENSASRSKYNSTCAACYLHVVANTASAGDAGVGDASATGGVNGTGGTNAGAGGIGGAGGARRDGSAADALVADAGATNSGGAVGSGGALQPGTGGGIAPGSGGALGTGGAISSTGGMAMGTGGAAPGATSSGASEGCACAMSSSSSDGSNDHWLWFLALGLTTVMRPRRGKRT